MNMSLHTHAVSLSVGSARDYVYAWLATNPSKANLIKSVSNLNLNQWGDSHLVLRYTHSW